MIFGFSGLNLAVMGESTLGQPVLCVINGYAHQPLGAQWISTVPENQPKRNEFYVARDGEVVIVCPACGYSKAVQAALIPKMSKPLTLKCQCGHRFQCFINFRNYYRKPVRFPGQGRRLSTGFTFDILIENLSREGLGFTCGEEDMPAVQEILLISFHLQDQNRTLIEKKIRVTHVFKGHVGGKFIDDRSDPNLGFFLFPSTR